MKPKRGWDFFEGNTTNMGMIQIIGIVAILGLIAVLVVMRKKDSSGVKTTSKSSSRI
jgi:LPXTG-motif cell wall-anchored protein